jgi:curved DNA-binding protein CbpA
MTCMKTTRASQGPLTGHSFLALVGALHRRRATGALRLTQDSADGQMEKALFFERGEIYAAASAAAEDAALTLLVRAGKLTPKEAEAAERQVLAGRNLGEALVAAHGFTPEDFAALRTAHVTAIFNSVCEWAAGRWELVTGARVPGGPLGCDTLTLLLGQARRLRVPDDFRQRAAAPDRHIVRTQNGQVPAQAKLTPREEYLLEMIRSPLGFEALSRTAALSEREIWQGLYALSCGGLIVFTPILQPRAEWVAVEASAAGPAAAARPERAAENLPAEVLSPQPREEAREGMRPGGREPLPAEVAERARAAETAAETAAATATPQAAETAEAVEPQTRPALEAEREKAARREAARREVERVKAVLAAARDDYAVLGLRLGATPTEVRQAFRRLVGQYHPDRFQQYADAETLGELNGIVSILRQAYETATEHALLHAALTKARARISFVPEVGAERDGGRAAEAAVRPPAANGHAEQGLNPLGVAAAKYREATLVEQEGDRAEAIRLLKEAVRLDPRNAAYRAHLASLLALDQNRHREAESHLLRAVELEPQNLSHRLQLGQLYRSLGQLPQAEQQLRIALKLNPYHQETIRELREITALKPASAQHSSSGRRAGGKPAGLFAKLFRRSYKV